MSYLEERNKRKLGLLPKMEFKKPPKPLKKISDKKKAEMAISGDDKLDLWFGEMRKKMVGKCLFCYAKTMKEDDEKFHFSIAHLLGKAIFPSVATHPDNWVELCFWDNSCHTNFDNGKITWEFIKDSHEWLVIKEKLLNVLPAVAESERKHKLYSKLNELVYDKSK